jgi:hypothetical protein
MVKVGKCQIFYDSGHDIEISEAAKSEISQKLLNLGVKMFDFTVGSQSGSDFTVLAFCKKGTLRKDAEAALEKWEKRNITEYP